MNLNLEYKLTDRWRMYADWINVFDETENQEYAVDASRVRAVFQTFPEVAFGITRRF